MSGPLTPVKETVEREIKLKVGRNFRFPELPGQHLPIRHFLSIYYDTPDFRLANAGITIRRRVEKRKGVWQLKLNYGPARLELESEGGHKIPPRELLRLLFIHTKGQELIPIAKLRTTRWGFRVKGLGGPLADITRDSVEVFEGNRVVNRFTEVEVELLEENEKVLENLVERLRQSGAQTGDQRPKVFQVLGLELPKLPEPPDPSISSVDQLQRMLKVQIYALMAHDPGTRLGTDPEELHQMRVAIVRVKAYLRTIKAMLVGGGADALGSELSWLRKSLGPVRDLDVLLELLEDEFSTLNPLERRVIEKFLARLRVDHEKARVVMLKTLESERYCKLIERLQSTIHNPLISGVAIHLGFFTGKEFRKLSKALKHITASTHDSEIHRLRIRAKRVRYAAELAETSVGKPAIRFIQELKRLQELLGGHQDAAVMEAWLCHTLRKTRGAQTAFTVGRIVERLMRRRRKARKSLSLHARRINKVGDKTWSKFLKQKHRSMSSLEESLPQSQQA